MSKRNNFIKALRFESPERVPINSELNPEYSYVSDCLGVGYGELKANEWGWQFERLENDLTMGQVKKHPLADWNQYKNWEVPSVAKESRFMGLKEKVSELKNKDYYVWGFTGSYIFERLHYLRGMDNMFEDLYLNEDKLKELGDKIADFQIEIIKAYAETGVDGIWGGDDWGTQNQLMISPAKWRKFFKPWYSRLFKTAHEYGLNTYMHSCGYNREIMGDLIECGLDVIELHQPTLMGIDWLSENYGGKICFSCSVDIQRTLPYGNKEKIEEQVVELVQKLGKFNGGLIFNFYPSREGIGVSKEIMDYMLEMVQKHRKYKI